MNRHINRQFSFAITDPLSLLQPLDLSINNIFGCCIYLIFHLFKTFGNRCNRMLLFADIDQEYMGHVRRFGVFFRFFPRSLIENGAEREKRH